METSEEITEEILRNMLENADDRDRLASFIHHYVTTLKDMHAQELGKRDLVRDAAYDQLEQDLQRREEALKQEVETHVEAHLQRQGLQAALQRHLRLDQELPWQVLKVSNRDKMMDELADVRDPAEMREALQLHYVFRSSAVEQLRRTLQDGDSDEVTRQMKRLHVEDTPEAHRSLYDVLQQPVPPDTTNMIVRTLGQMGGRTLGLLRRIMGRAFKAVRSVGRKVTGMWKDVRIEKELRSKLGGHPMCEENYEQVPCERMGHCVWTGEQTCVWEPDLEVPGETLPAQQALERLPRMTALAPCAEAANCDLCPGRPELAAVAGEPASVCGCRRAGGAAVPPAALRRELRQHPRRQWLRQAAQLAGPQCPRRALLPWQRFTAASVGRTRTSALAWWATGAGKTALALAAMRQFLPKMLPESEQFDPTFKIIFLYPDDSRLGDNFTQEVQQGYLSRCDENDILSLVDVGGGVDRAARPAHEVPGRRRKIFLFPLSIFGHLLPGGGASLISAMDKVSDANMTWQGHFKACMAGTPQWNTATHRYRILRNTLLLVDEAHHLQYLKSDSHSRSRHADAYTAISDSVLRCHREQHASWADRTQPHPQALTTLLMTATPLLRADQPQRFRRLANMLEPTTDGRLSPLDAPLDVAEARQRLQGRIFHVDPKGTAFYPASAGVAATVTPPGVPPAELVPLLDARWTPPAQLAAWKLAHTFSAKQVRPTMLPALRDAFPKGAKLAQAVRSTPGVHLVYVDLETSRVVPRTAKVQASGVATPVPDAVVALLNHGWGRDGEVHLDHLFRLMVPRPGATPAVWGQQLQQLDMDRLVGDLSSSPPRWLPGRDGQRVLNLYSPYRLPTSFVDENGGMAVRQAFALLLKRSIELFNAVNTKQKGSGKFVKVVMITRTMLEGVSFLNTRHLHMLQRPPTAKDRRQLMGRVSRMFGMCAIPRVDQRQIQYHLYCVSDDCTMEDDLDEDPLLRALRDISSTRHIMRELKPQDSLAGGGPLRIRRWRPLA